MDQIFHCITALNHLAPQGASPLFLTLMAGVGAPQSGSSGSIPAPQSAGVGSFFHTYVLPVVGALLVLIIAWILAAFAASAVERILTKVKVDLTLARFFGALTRWGIIIIGIALCLPYFGVDSTTLAALLGSAGIAVGLAMQGTLSNISAGVMLLIFRPFHIGDYITVSGVSGTVFTIDLFVTILDTPQNTRIILPNGSVFGNTIENVTFHDQRRVDVNVGTAYDADIDKTREVLLDAITNNIPNRLKDREPQVALTGLGASTVDWQLRVWADGSVFYAVKEDVIAAAKKALDANNIGIPFPQQDIYIKEMPGKNGTE